MGRSVAVFIAFVFASAACGFAASVTCERAGLEPLIAPAITSVPIAVFAWLRRSHDTLEFVFPAIAVSYAAFLGIALARVPSISMLSPWTIGALSERWPAVLLAGVPYALIMTVAIAMPIALIPAQRRRRPHASQEALRFFDEHTRGDH